MYIYVHKNKINGKCYVGQTKQLPRKRWLNGEGYIECPKFYKAIKKYGWNNFDHIIIAKCSEEFADQIEQHYIKIYDSVTNGYNIESGGHIEKTISQETRQKMSLAHKGKIVSEETKLKISLGHKGKPNGRLGTHHSKETKLKMSLIRKGKPSTRGKGWHHSKETIEKMKHSHKRKELKI